MPLRDSEIFEGELGDGEFLIWTGRPDPTKLFGKGDAALIPFGGFFGCFSLFWIGGASAAGGIFGLFGLPFLAMGLYMAFGRFFYKKWLKERTWYGLTNRRAIIVKILPQRIVESVSLSNCPNITKEDKSRGAGTIIFGQSPSVAVSNNLNQQPDMGFELLSGHKSIGPLRFSDIEDVGGVYQKIQFIRFENKS